MKLYTTITGGKYHILKEQTKIDGNGIYLSFCSNGNAGIAWTAIEEIDDLEADESEICKDCLKKYKQWKIKVTNEEAEAFDKENDCKYKLNETAVCPYCGEENEIHSEDYQGSDAEYEYEYCKCGKAFGIIENWSVTFSTFKMHACENCGKVVADITTSPYNRKIKLCQRCSNQEHIRKFNEEQERRAKNEQNNSGAV